MSPENGAKTGSKTLFAPTVVSELEESMQIWQDEAFGPVLGIMVVKTEGDAIVAANATGYGLSSALFTRDLRKAFELAKKLEAG